MTDDISRRRFLGTAAATFAAAELGLVHSFSLQAPRVAGMRATSPRAESIMSFGPVKQIDAGVLNVGYVDEGPANGPPVLLLYGWPYDIHSFAEVTPLLVAAGYRVIVPYLRGYGTTRILSAQTPRNGNRPRLAWMSWRSWMR